jgi:hypothetical protein
MHTGFLGGRLKEKGPMGSCGTGYTHSLNHGTENLLTLHFNGKI